MASSVTPFLAGWLEDLRIVPRQRLGAGVNAMCQVNQCRQALAASLPWAWASEACRPVFVGSNCLHGRQQDRSENYAELRRAYHSFVPRQNDASDRELNIVETCA